MLLFQIMQIIRRQGPSIKSFLDMTAVLVKGFIKDIEILQPENTPRWAYVVFYTVDEIAQQTVYNSDRLYAAWLRFVQYKFPMITVFDRGSGIPPPWEVD